MMLLRHYLDARRVLRYDAQTGLFDEFSREQLADGTAMAFGFFADSQCGLWGVYASPAGPMLFHGTRRFPLMESSTSIELAPGKEENRFGLRQGGLLRAECKYKRPAASEWGFDSWSGDEESADFFLWLRNQVETDDFFRRYTRPSEPQVVEASDAEGF